MTEARREFLKAALLGAGFTVSPGFAAPTPGEAGLPGPYPGRVIRVDHPGSVRNRVYDRTAVRAMMRKGVMELTGAPTPEDAWRVFFSPADVVGIKLNPVGRPFVVSAPEVFLEIVDGLKSAGVKPANIVAYDRYKAEFIAAGFDKWLPEGVRWTYGTDKPHPLQLDMDMYDETQYVELPLVLPRADAANPHHRRSYLAKFITQDVNKMVNLCVLKHHQSAGVTLALKNLSHGLVNNVSRSHSTRTLNTCGTFIPAIVDHPVIRRKVVLNVLDGVLGAYHGGPGRKVEKYVWEHKAMYFATDPVAMDKTGLRVIDEKRGEASMPSIALGRPDADSTFLNMQVEHIEISAAMGLGEYDDKKIDVRRFSLG